MVGGDERDSGEPRDGPLMPDNCTCSNFPGSLGNVTIGAALLVGTDGGAGLFPLTLRGGDPVNHMYSSVIQFQAANGVPIWQLGSGGVGGTQQEFSLYDQVSGVQRLYIGPTGTVGIGTAGPAARMHVYSPQAHRPAACRCSSTCPSSHRRCSSATRRPSAPP